MIFKLHTSGHIYSKKHSKKLEALGFKFKNNGNTRWKLDHDPTIEINSLDELILFADEWGQLIVSDGKIEIYDDYRE